MSRGRGDRGQRATGAARASTLLIRNTVWNVLGAGLPILLALVTFPVLIRGIGTERFGFGVLAIAWVVFGYFGVESQTRLEITGLAKTTDIGPRWLNLRRKN